VRRPHADDAVDRAHDPELAPLRNRGALVAAHDASHMTSALTQTFASPEVQIARFLVTGPLRASGSSTKTAGT